MNLDLLLAYADEEQRPVLEEGIPFDEATKAVGAKKARQGEPYQDFSADPNDLGAQRWGIVVPEGREGDRLLEIVKPLRELRESEQEAEAMIYRVPVGQGWEDAVKWVKNVFRSESVSLDDLPRYLFVLGDLDKVSWELQQAFGGCALTGRLACPNDDGYDAYVKKVLRWEQSPSQEEHARALFFTARDNTAATSIGYRALVEPSIEKARAKLAKGTFAAKEVYEIAYESPYEAKDTFLREVAGPDPAMLFSMTHGLGAPRKGWGSVEEQLATQGAMSMGSGARITAEDIADKPFLPGGIWFFLACYGGGTPQTSAYYHWLAKLREGGGFAGRIDSVLTSLPKPGDRPFIAALPKAALSNPNGPLAVIGHMDLAWTYSFQDVGAGGQDRPSRYEGIFRNVVNGKRAALAHNELLGHMFDTSEVLAKMMNDETARELAGDPLPKSKDRELEKANLWMLRADLAGYILLGDPATRLPIKRGRATREEGIPEVSAAVAKPAAAKKAPEPEKPAAAPTRDPAVMEEAVIAAIVGEEGEKKIAERYGITRQELTQWKDVYQEAGRAALAKLR